MFQNDETNGVVLELNLAVYHFRRLFAIIFPSQSNFQHDFNSLVMRPFRVMRKRKAYVYNENVIDIS
jgi:hypothetical protein